MVARLVCGSYFRARGEGAEGKSVGDAFGGDQNVWRDTIMFDSKHFPGAPETALDLVGDEKDPVSVENFLDLAKIIRRGNNDAALPKHRFGDKGCNVACGLKRNHIIETLCAMSRTTIGIVRPQRAINVRRGRKGNPWSVGPAAFFTGLIA